MRPAAPGFDSDGATQVGDSYEVEFVDDNFPRTTGVTVPKQEFCTARLTM